MFGIIIAVLIGLFQYIFVVKSPEAIWLTSTNFLFWWYIVWSSVLVVIIFLVMLGITATKLYSAGFTGIGRELLHGCNELIKGKVPFLDIILFFITANLKVGGTYLLSTAVTLTEQGYVWNTPTLIFGVLALSIGFINIKIKRSSSSKLNF